MNALQTLVEELLIFSLHRNILHIGAIMAAFFDDKPLIEGIDEDWDEKTTGRQIMRPERPDTLRPERPDCPVLIPSSFARTRDRVISQDIYSYEPCGLPTGNFMPPEQAQIRLMTASPITLRACIPAPDQVTPEQAYFKDLDFYKKTLFHTPFLSRGRAVTLLEYRDAKIVFEVDDWFRTLPQGVQRYLLPLQSKYARWYDENVRDLTQNYSYCVLCKTKQTNLQRHHMQHHARWRTIWFCPIPGCPSSLANKEGLVKHLISRPHGCGIDTDDDEVLSFDLGPEPYDPSIQERLPSDEWLDDYQQGLHPGSSEPKPDLYDRYLAMPIQPSILDIIRSDIDTDEPEASPPQERAPSTAMRWDYDYIRDEPPVVQRITEEQRQSTPLAARNTPMERPRPALDLPRPRAASAPPTAHPAKRMALNYAPVIETITPPVTPPRAQVREIEPPTETVPETPSHILKHGRSRGRGTWRAPQKIAPGVGTRSKTRAAELEKRDNAQAQAAHARWPPTPDATVGIQKLTRELHISDVPRNVHKELQRVLPPVEEEEVIQVS